MGRFNLDKEVDQEDLRIATLYKLRSPQSAQSAALRNPPGKMGIFLLDARSLPRAVSGMDGGVHLLGLCGLESTAGNTYVKRAAH